MTLSFNIKPPRADAKISREGWRHPKTRELIKVVKFTQEEVDWYNGIGASKEGFPEDPAVGKEVLEPVSIQDLNPSVQYNEDLPPEGDEGPVELTVTEEEYKEILDAEKGETEAQATE